MHRWEDVIENGHAIKIRGVPNIHILKFDKTTFKISFLHFFATRSFNTSTELLAGVALLLDPKVPTPQNLYPKLPGARS